MSKVSLSSQSRNFHFVLYPDSETYLTTKVLFELVVNLKYCSKWAFALHDKDKGEDGSDLKPHYHLVVSCKYPVKYSDILNHLDLPDNAVSLPSAGTKIRSYRSMVRYLIHADSPHKFQYDVSSISSSFDVSSYFDDVSDDKQSSAFIDLLEFVSDRTHSRHACAMYAVHSGYLGYYRQYYRILWDVREEIEYQAYEPNYSRHSLDV